MTLPAKASAPRLGNTVPRVRVFRIFDRALARYAVWVTGPAGAGKTTAVASYLAARRRRAVWYDVDATDSDTANVFLYLAKAAKAASRSRRRLPVFQVQHHGSLRAFARKFFEAIYAVLPVRSALVLDNCHSVAESQPWSEILEEATRSVPDGGALFLVSRGDPPRSFSRQIVNERLAVVSGAELRFSDKEAGVLARRRMPRLAHHRRDEIARLCALADGWAAGLVLVLDHAARGQPTPEMAQHDERLFDYFSAEILAELPAEAQEVLRAIALLPCVTEPMASAVSGSATAGVLLADLHRSGLLVERLTTQPTAYRFHPLFKAFLLAGERFPPALLARAAAACVEGGFLDEAVDLLARVDARAELARLVLAHASRLVAEGRYRTLGEWLARLNEDAIAAEPWLRFWQATVNMAADQAASRVQFELAFDGFRTRGDAAGLYLTIAGAAQVIFIEAKNFRRLDSWFARYDELRRDGPPPPSDDVEATALASLLMAVCYVRPRYPAGPSWLERARLLTPGAVGTRARLWSALTMFMSITGDTGLSWNELVARRPPLTPEIDPLTRMLMTEGEIHRALVTSWREALAMFREALELARGEALQLFEPPFLAGCAAACALGGDDDGAAEYLRQAAASAAETPSAHLMPGGLLEYTRGVVAFARADFDLAARHLAQGLVRNGAIGMGWGEMFTRTLYVLALGALGRHQEADHEAARMSGDTAPVGVTAVGMGLFAAERSLRERDASAAAAASRALAAAREYGGYVFLYMRGVPRLVAFGLRDAAHARWLADGIVEHNIRPWPEHLDLVAWPHAVRVRTHGGFVLAGDRIGRSRKVSKAPLRLLKCLVAAGPEPLSVAAVCDALWPDDLPGASRRRLDLTVHRLRKLIGEDAVRLAEGAIAIDRARCFVDAWAFASLGARAERRLQQNPSEARNGLARVLFEDALALYRGPLLPGEDDVTMIVGARARLQRRFVRLVLTFAGALEASASAGGEAAVVYENALAIDELPEPLWRGLVAAYLALGRPGDAVKAFQRCQLALHAAGTDPSGELRALHDEARARMQLGARAESRPAIPSNPKDM